MQIIKSDGKTAITYPYTPNVAAAYIFVVVFGIGTLIHIFWAVRFRAAYFIPLIIGAICETFGYYGRSWSSRDQPNVKPYVMQYLLILPAPIFLVATVYMSLGRIATGLNATDHTMIRPSRLTKLFVCLDILCFVVQIAGAGMESTTDPKMGDIGGKVVTAGVILQMICSAWFLTIILHFWKRLARVPTLTSNSGLVKWRLHLIALSISTLMMMIRNLARAIQELQGFYGFVNSHEAFTYIFDAVPMAIVVWILVVIHPSRLVQAAKKGSKLNLPQFTQAVEQKQEDSSMFITSQ